MINRCTNAAIAAFFVTGLSAAAVSAHATEKIREQAGYQQDTNTDDLSGYLKVVRLDYATVNDINTTIQASIVGIVPAYFMAILPNIPNEENISSDRTIILDVDGPIWHHADSDKELSMFKFSSLHYIRLDVEHRYNDVFLRCSYPPHSIDADIETRYCKVRSSEIGDGKDDNPLIDLRYLPIVRLTEDTISTVNNTIQAKIPGAPPVAYLMAVLPDGGSVILDRPGAKWNLLTSEEEILKAVPGTSLINDVDINIRIDQQYLRCPGKDNHGCCHKIRSEF